MKMTKPVFFEVGELGVLDFAVHLRQRFFAAHGQHGMAQPDEDGDKAREVREMLRRRAIPWRLARASGCAGRETAAERVADDRSV